MVTPVANWIRSDSSIVRVRVVVGELGKTIQRGGPRVGDQVDVGVDQARQQSPGWAIENLAVARNIDSGGLYPDNPITIHKDNTRTR